MVVSHRMGINRGVTTGNRYERYNWFYIRIHHMGSNVLPSGGILLL